VDISDLRHTIVPKSDQLNADQLLGGSMTVRVSQVRLGSTSEQPVTINYEGDGGRPFKPCLTMRRVLILAWGADGTKWPGRSMTLYNDPKVRFGPDETGGVRISHLSHIPQDIKVALTASKGKKAQYLIKRLADGDQEHIAAMKAADTVEALKEAFAKAYRAAGKAEDRRASFKAEYDRRMQEIAPSALLQEYVAKVNEAANSDEAAVFLDEARSTLNPTELSELNKAFAARFGDA
jgi:hypothetical protein